MAVPIFTQAGAGTSNTGTTLTASYPASGLAADDIAICQVMFRQSGPYAIGFPGDWAEVDEVGNAALTASWAWKRLDGSESGNISITGGPGGGIGTWSRMYIFRGCIATGTPYEANTTASGATVTTYSTSAIVTTGADRLAVSLLSLTDDDKGFAAGVTGSNVTWALSVAQYVSASGLACTLLCQQADVVAPTSVTAGSATYSGAESWFTHTFALLPAPTGVPLAWVTA